jgi:glycerate 2-kinase
VKSIKLGTTLPADASFRGEIETILNKGLQAADPYQSVYDALTEADLIWMSHGATCLAIGKAAQPMLQGAIDFLGARLHTGICITKELNTEYFRDERIQYLVGGHPHPTPDSLRAADELEKILEDLPPTMATIWLISGGGSALVTKPFEGISLVDYAELNRMMLAENLSIDQINIVRKHIDRVKGGRLLRSISDRPGMALILSDVVSGDLSTIASGMTAPDHSSYQDAIDILVDTDLFEDTPQTIRDHLEAGCRGQNPETLRNAEFQRLNFSNRIIGGIQISLNALAESAQSLGWEAEIRTPLITGDVEYEAARILREIPRKVDGRKCLIYGGEGTVEIRGEGLGGRNSLMAAILARGIAGWDGCTIITFASDGDDGNSLAAGAIINTKTYTRAYQSLLHFEYDIENSNSANLFRELDDAIVTGLTGTNVNDWILIFLSGSREV